MAFAQSDISDVHCLPPPLAINVEGGREIHFAGLSPLPPCACVYITERSFYAMFA